MDMVNPMRETIPVYESEAARMTEERRMARFCGCHACGALIADWHGLILYRSAERREIRTTPADGFTIRAYCERCGGRVMAGLQHPDQEFP